MKRKTETAPIKWNQAQAVIKCLMADGDHNTALLFASGFYFGLRISDILSLKWGQILSDRFELEEQKTGKTRRITVSSKYRQLVTQAVDLMAVIAANKRIRSAFTRYGITTQNPSSHTLRKTFGRRVYENLNQSENALITLSKIFNHRDISTTRKYIGITQQQIENVYLSL